MKIVQKPCSENGGRKMTVYGYARVSTYNQDYSDQVDELIKNGVPAENIYAEKYTGTKKDRPKFTKLKNKLVGGDELVVAKLDRLGRKTSDVIDFLDRCGKRDITVNILNMGKLDNTPNGKLMRNIVSAFAEYERDMIVSRMEEGKEYAKAHNPDYREGRPKRKITDRYRKVYEVSQEHSIRETALITGVSESTVKRIKRQIKQEEGNKK